MYNLKIKILTDIDVEIKLNEKKYSNNYKLRFQLDYILK